MKHFGEFKGLHSALCHFGRILLIVWAKIAVTTLLYFYGYRISAEEGGICQQGENKPRKVKLHNLASNDCTMSSILNAFFFWQASKRTVILG